MLKIQHYLNIEHNYDTMNCLTFLEYIYKREFNINFDSVRKLFKIDGLEDLRELLRLDPQISTDIENWKKINLTSLLMYDIIIFKDRKNRVSHFGMYLDNNLYLKLENLMMNSGRNFTLHIDAHETY